MGGMFSTSKPDTSAAENQIAETRAETKRLKEEAEMSRREKAEAESAQRLARTKGGKRGLLSSVRGYSEMSEEDDTLGA
jgi:hypothetical protein